jgi:2,3-bisphosphoglycerate-independent phosphoglycerate mutase
MKPGSDIANLAVLGYDPAHNYSGRSPLEALSVGVEMEDDDVVFRCNLVTLTENEPYAEKTILDHSSGEISTEDADILMDAIRQNLQTDTFRFYTGTSYRHIMVWKKGKVMDLAQPHDHLGQQIGPQLPNDPAFLDMMEKSYQILNDHPLNVQRAAQGKNKANSAWFWGAGTKPSLANFFEKTGKKGAMISAVDLLKGIAVGAGMQVIEVPGANGSLHTNYTGKANAAIDAFKRGKNYVYVHVEGPDECGHRAEMENKVLSIELIDQKILAPVYEYMKSCGEPFKIMVLPDHPTPLRIRTHSIAPVPFFMYDSEKENSGTASFSEAAAAETGVYISEGHTLLSRFITAE